MKLFKYQSFLESNQSIEQVCKKYGIKNYIINDDGSVDVNGDVNFIGKGLLTKLPLKFRNITGDFILNFNHLTTLEGSPESVGGDFQCSRNKLTSLEGAPKTVSKDFNCDDNKLTSLIGAPKTVGRDFNCYKNNLKNLEGSPESVGGYFQCSNNQLTTLEGGPKLVGGNFYISQNELTSLKGGPELVGGNEYYFVNNKVNDLTGFPEFWEGYIDFNKNPIDNILKKFPVNKVCKAIYWMNEFGVTHDGEVNLERLEEVFITLGLEVNI